MKKVIVVLSVVLTGAWGYADSLADLRKEVEALKQDVAELKRLVQGAQAAEPAEAADPRAGIRRKTEEDRKTYSVEQLREIETLYQSANKDLKNPEAKAALAALIEKYPKANRTGCAVQYMGQMSTGAEREKYLTLAIKDFGDCYYGNGVQVGAYARFWLGHHYKDAGKGKEAKALFDEIRKDYPDAVDHKGRRLTELLPK